MSFVRYDKVLSDGLPNWKSAVYYYRHYHKMGLLEMSVLLFVILTVGQYIVSWAVYAEKKYTAVSWDLVYLIPMGRLTIL